MDPKSAWALGDFKEAQLELLLVGNSRPGSNSGRGGIRRGLVTDTPGRDSGIAGVESHIAYQGESLAGHLVVRFDSNAGSGELLLQGMEYLLNRKVELSVAFVSTARRGGRIASTSSAIKKTPHQLRRVAETKKVMFPGDDFPSVITETIFLPLLAAHDLCLARSITY